MSRTALSARRLHTAAPAMGSGVQMSKFDNKEIDYDNLRERLSVVRNKLNRPLTASEKILYSHIDDPENQVCQCVCGGGGRGRVRVTGCVRVFV